MNRIVALGDLHLDQSTLGVDRFEDGSEALDRAAEEAIKLEADAFIFTGDLCDPHTARSHRAVAALAAAQVKLNRAGVWPLFLAGNHDVVEDGSGSTVLDALAPCGMAHVITRPREFPLIPRVPNGKPLCHVIALPFTPSSHNYDPDAWVRGLSGPPDPSTPVLVIGHLNIEGIKVGSETTEMPRGRDVFWPLEALEARFPHALKVAGHYHTPQTFRGVHVIGSALRLRFDEKDNAPGFLVLEV